MESRESLILEELKKNTVWNVIAQKYHISSKPVAETKNKYSSQQSPAYENQVSTKAF
jgi:hypothetical protein